MNKRLIQNLLIPFCIILIVGISIFTISNFTDWDNLKALIYPPEEIDYDSSGDSHGNTLKVVGFRDGVEDSVNITQTDDYESDNFTSIPNSDMGGSTPYSITKKEDIKNVVLRAPGGYKWSGCDAIRGSECQISVSDNQIRKIEIHSSTSEDGLPLQLWNISNNTNFTGPISEEIFDTINPQIAFKAANISNLGGGVPDVDNLNSKQLNLGGNNIGGNIPDEITNLTQLEYLGLYNNRLTGNIPEDIGDMSSLKYLLLYNNQLTGSINEIDWESLSGLQRLELHNNQLSGEIPKSLKNINLTPSELRLYNNNFSAIEDGLIEEAPWSGINLSNNNLSQSVINSALREAADNSGSYLDFCGNPVDGGTIYYGLDGEMTSTNIREAVNDAAEEWGAIYIPIRLEQRYQVWGGWRGYSACVAQHPCNVSEIERERNIYDEEGNVKDTETYIEKICGGGTSCNRPYYDGRDTPPGGDVACAKITDKIESPEDIIEESHAEGIPEELKDVSYYEDCTWATHPEGGKECEPDPSSCEVIEDGECSGDPDNCYTVESGECIFHGEFMEVSHRDYGGDDEIEGFWGSCPW